MLSLKITVEKSPKIQTKSNKFSLISRSKIFNKTVPIKEISF
jgi:hypothetical protein